MQVTTDEVGGSVGVRQANREHLGQTGGTPYALSGQWVKRGMLAGSTEMYSI